MFQKSYRTIVRTVVISRTGFCRGLSVIIGPKNKSVKLITGELCTIYLYTIYL